MPGIKYWDGSQWVSLPQSAVQAHDGSAFAAVNDATYHDGSAFQSFFGSGGGQSWAAVDRYNDGGLTEYTGEISSSEFHHETANPLEGSGHLRAEVPSSGDWHIYSQSGLDRYPSRGDVIRWFVNPSLNSSNLSPSLWVGQQSASAGSGYGAEIKSSDGQMYLLRDGSSIGSISTSSSFPTDSYTELRLRWGVTGSGDATIEFERMDTNDVLSVDDADYDSGGIGFKVFGSGGETVDIDQVEVATE